MIGHLRVVRDGEVKFTLPADRITTRDDGTLWYQGMPLLGVTDPTEKERIAKLTKTKKYDQIPAECFVRLGENANGLWAGYDEAWATHPANAAIQAARAAQAVEESKTVSIHLSTRGWGDFSSLEWRGDITRPDAEILAECRNLLANGHDVDTRDQTDAEILTKIGKAREMWRTAPARKAAYEKAEADDLQRKIDSGFCFNCETWCDGDCGNYRPGKAGAEHAAQRGFKNALRESRAGQGE